MSTAEFTLLLTENADFLKPFAINLTKDHESAKDLFQDTLFRALSNKDKYNVGTNIKAWLYTIMRNIFINDYNDKFYKAVENNHCFIIFNYIFNRHIQLQSQLKSKWAWTYSKFYRRQKNNYNR